VSFTTTEPLLNKDQIPMHLGFENFGIMAALPEVQRPTSRLKLARRVQSLILLAQLPLNIESCILNSNNRSVISSQNMSHCSALAFLNNCTLVLRCIQSSAEKVQKVNVSPRVSQRWSSASPTGFFSLLRKHSGLFLINR